MIPLKDLFGTTRFLSPRKGKDALILSERAGLISFFVKELEREPKVVAIRMAHYTLSDLYALKSAYSERLRRNGKESALKYLWWVTRTKKV